MSPLPAYTADSSTPLYDEVSQKLQGLIGEHPTTEKVLDAGATLSDEEINVLANGYDTHHLQLDKKQKANFTVGVGQTLSSNLGQSHLELAGNEASQAVKDIDETFIELQLKIAQIDKIYKSDFQPGLSSIQDVCEFSSKFLPLSLSPSPILTPKKDFMEIL